MAVGCLCSCVLSAQLMSQEATDETRSISPDKKWEYKCEKYGDLGQCACELFGAGSSDVVLDLEEELSVHGPEESEARVLWAPNSKRFAFNYSPLHAHHTTYVTVAFYELRDGKWVEMDEPVKLSEQSAIVQIAKAQLPKKLRTRREGAVVDVFKVQRWIDDDTVEVFARSTWEDRADLAFRFTLKCDKAGKWKVTATHALSKKEREADE